MPGMKWTPNRVAVLKAIAAYHGQRHPHPDHHAIAVACGRPYSAADFAHAPLRALSEAGYIEVAGKWLQARTWRVTDAGRAALQTL